MNDVICVEKLSKSFGDVHALDQLDLSIPQGGVYGVLGPNGAGKSTLFRILLGLVRPTSGSAQVMGGPVGVATTGRRIGSMIETPRYPPYMTARQVLRWLGLAHGLDLKGEIDQWLDRVGLTEAANRRVKGFSVGMLQRLGVAAALIGRPEMLILDEPTSGMDPPGIQDMRALIRSLADDDGVTVILASHQLLEVQRICDRVAILNRGKLAAEGKVSELTATGEQLRFIARPVDGLLRLVGDKARRDGDAVFVRVARNEGPALIHALVNAGVEIEEARWVGTDLESVFMDQTGSVTGHMAEAVTSKAAATGGSDAV